MRLRSVCYYFILCMGLLVVATACGSNNATGSDYELVELLGEWELINSTDPEFKSCPDDPPILTIKEAEIDFHGIIVDTGCNGGSLTIESSFNGSAFVTNFLGIKVKYEVTSLSSDEFTWQNNFDDISETFMRLP